MKTKKIIQYSVIVSVIHFLALQWVMTSLENEGMRAAIAFEKTGVMPEIDVPPVFHLVTYPIAAIGINVAGGVLPIWAALGQSALWGFLAFLVLKFYFRKNDGK